MLKSNFGNIHHIVYQNKIEAGKIVVKFLPYQVQGRGFNFQYSK